MGAPIQEEFAMRIAATGAARAVWCVGAMFEYFGGARARAPVFLRNAGLEWLFRLVLEPRRLWRRYLIGNLVFLKRVFRLPSPAPPCVWLQTPIKATIITKAVSRREATFVGP